MLAVRVLYTLLASRNEATFYKSCEMADSARRRSNSPSLDETMDMENATKPITAASDTTQSVYTEKCK